jgi:hypothetical protein
MLNGWDAVPLVSASGLCCFFKPLENPQNIVKIKARMQVVHVLAIRLEKLVQNSGTKVKLAVRSKPTRMIVPYPGHICMRVTWSDFP